MDVALGFAILLLVALLIAPLFHIEYLENWGSIDSTFIADARFLIEYWPHPSWQPLWYCGTRFDYIYPPALRYATAMTAMAGDVSTARGYHLYTATIYCLGVAAVYAFVRVAGNSKALVRHCSGSRNAAISFVSFSAPVPSRFSAAHSATSERPCQVWRRPTYHFSFSCSIGFIVRVARAEPLSPGLDGARGFLLRPRSRT